MANKGDDERQCIRDWSRKVLLNDRNDTEYGTYCGTAIKEEDVVLNEKMTLIESQGMEALSFVLALLSLSNKQNDSPNSPPASTFQEETLDKFAPSYHYSSWSILDEIVWNNNNVLNDNNNKMWKKRQWKHFDFYE